MSVYEKAKYLVVDTETTTGNVDTAFILTLHAEVLDKEFNCLSEFSIAIKPNYTEEGRDAPILIEPEAMAVNKIDLLSHYKYAVPLWKAQTQFTSWLLNCTKHTSVLYEVGKSKLVCSTPLTVVGHCYHFDLFLIRKYLFSEVETLVKRKGLDTAVIAETLKVLGKLPPDTGTSLVNLAKLAGVKEKKVNSEAHNAKCDVQFVKQVLQWELNLLGGNTV